MVYVCFVDTFLLCRADIYSFFKNKNMVNKYPNCLADRLWRGNFSGLRTFLCRLIDGGGFAGMKKGRVGTNDELKGE